MPLVLPDDLEDVPALERCLREWILRNLDHWVHGKNRNPYTMIQALMCTWAIDMYKWKPPRRMLRRFEQAAEQTVGEDLASSRSLAVQRPADTRVGAGPVPARGEQSHGFAYHRATENTEQDEIREASHLAHASQCLGGEEQSLLSTEQNRAASTPAGGRKVLPRRYEQSPIERTISTYRNRWRDRSHGCHSRGQAPSAHCGWRTPTTSNGPLPVRSARRNAAAIYHRATENTGAADGPSTYAATLGKVQTFDHGARAFCPPFAAWQVDPSMADTRLALGEREIVEHEWAECPRSVALGDSSPEVAISGRAVRCSDRGTTLREVTARARFPRPETRPGVVRPPSTSTTLTCTLKTCYVPATSYSSRRTVRVRSGLHSQLDRKAIISALSSSASALGTLRTPLAGIPREALAQEAVDRHSA